MRLHRIVLAEIWACDSTSSNPQSFRASVASGVVCFSKSLSLASPTMMKSPDLKHFVCGT